jgi:hypothetical protein
MSDGRASRDKGSSDRRELLVVAPLKFTVEVVTMAEQGRTP